MDFRDSGEGRLSFRIFRKDGESFIFVYDHVKQGESDACLVTQTDISSVVDTQRSMTAYFQKIYLIILCIGFPLIFALSRMITGCRLFDPLPGQLPLIQHIRVADHGSKRRL